MTKKIRIGALISGGGTNLQAIVDACRDGRINGRMVFVGSDNPGADGLARAHQDNIPTFVVDYNSIIRAAKAGLDKVKLPDDFDYTDIRAKQNFFGDRDDPAGINLFLTSKP